MKKTLAILLTLVLLLGVFPVSALADDDVQYVVDFAVLSTTDMHGKCWDKNVLTDASENNNMLRVATAVKGLREIYGDNMLLIDNGDLYQGNPVSSVQLNMITSGDSTDPAAMALCLGDIGYDVSVLGNHEFNYPWKTMTGVYDYLESRGVSVVTANLYYDGTDGVHEAGTNVFTPYITKTIQVAGEEHKIGVLGFENTDCPRWDIPDNYPGIVFAHPDNTELSMAWEAQRYIPQMQAEGCDFIIVAYHSGTGSTTGDLVYGTNTEGQVSRMIAECEGINMVIAGHDHATGYSNSYIKDKNGMDVLVVNGGGQDLTKTVFSFTVAGDTLCPSVKETVNLKLKDYTSDADLKAKIEPYATLATNYVNQKAGEAVGEWDTSSNYFLEQTDTMDLINEAQMVEGTKYLAKKYDTDEKKAALFAATGLDHLDVDMSSTSAVTSNSYYVKPGEITMKTVYQMYRFDNTLYLLPLTGAQIKAILEKNAAEHLKANVKNGTVTYTTIGEDFTNPVFGGLNFTYDMYQPEGERAIIEGFSNGRKFELDKTYIVGVNNYHLGNTGCGFGAYGPEDAIWSQIDDLGGGTVPEIILEYIQEKTPISTEPFTWTWKLDYTGDPSAVVDLAGDVIARKAEDFANEAQVVLYYEAEGTVLGLDPVEGSDNKLSAVDAVVTGEYLGTSEKAAVMTIGLMMDENNSFTLKSEKGYLTAGETGNSLRWAEEVTDCGKWYLSETEGGWHVMNVGAAYNGNHNQALEWYGGFTTYGVKDTPAYLFNVYEVVNVARKVAEPTDLMTYAIFYDAEETCVGADFTPVKNFVSGDLMPLPLDDNTLIVTMYKNEDGNIDFRTPDGKHLSAGLALTDELLEDDKSLWQLEPVEGGFHIINAGLEYNGVHNQALEFYSGRFTTYGVKDTPIYLFNFYELPLPAAEPDEPQPVENPFTDVAETDYFCDAVLWAFHHDPQITNGTDATHFSPSNTCTRAQVVTFLWRANGGPEPTSTESPFEDVKDADAYYYKAVLWAVEKKITNGVDNTHFGPDKGCTRGQVVTFLWRAEGEPAPKSTENPFTDVKTGAYYYNAVLWAVNHEPQITNGTSKTTFSPDNTCTRGQIVTFLYRDLGQAPEEHGGDENELPIIPVH